MPTDRPDVYGGYRPVRHGGRLYAAPEDRADEILARRRLTDHPGVLVADSHDDLERLIDAAGPPTPPREVGRHRGFLLVETGDGVCAVPEAAGTTDPDLVGDHHRPAVRRGRTVREVRTILDDELRADPVEFAGWLPIFEWSGKCGSHPQFKHIADPPAGYRFTCSTPPGHGLHAAQKPPRFRPLSFAARKVAAAWGAARPLVALFRIGGGVSLRTRVRVAAAVVRLFVLLTWRGCSLRATLRFLQSRHLQSQLLLGSRRDLVFLTSMPYTYNQRPWVVEIEDPTTLFYPLIQNGGTGRADVKGSPYVPIVRTLLEADACKAIVTHMRSTAELVPTLFDSDKIRRKIVYAPMGVKLPARFQRHDPQPAGAPIDLLFINSWSQTPANFFVRGGLDVLEAFAALRERYPQVRLTIRSHLPLLDDHFRRILEAGWVRVVDRFMTADEMAELHAASHIFLLPAAASTSSRCSRPCLTGWPWSGRTAGAWRSTSNTSGTAWSSAGGTARPRGPRRPPACCARTTSRCKAPTRRSWPGWSSRCRGWSRTNRCGGGSAGRRERTSRRGTTWSSGTAA